MQGCQILYIILTLQQLVTSDKLLKKEICLYRNDRPTFMDMISWESGDSYMRWNKTLKVLFKSKNVKMFLFWRPFGRNEVRSSFTFSLAALQPCGHFLPKTATVAQFLLWNSRTRGLLLTSHRLSQNYLPPTHYLRDVIYEWSPRQLI